MTKRDNSGRVVDAPFGLYGLHGAYEGLHGPALIARLAVDLNDAEAGELVEVSHVLGRVALRRRAG